MVNFSFSNNTRQTVPTQTVDLNDPESVKRFNWKGFLLVGGTVPLIFFAIGAFFIVQDYVRQTQWNDASAQVITSEITGYYDREDSTYMYRPLIEYEYVFQGKPYTSRLEYSGGTSIRSTVQYIVDRYPVGATITIKVNPEHPALSTIPGEVSIWMYVIAGFGLLLEIIFVSVGVRGLRKKKELLAKQYQRTTYTPR